MLTGVSHYFQIQVTTKAQDIILMAYTGWESLLKRPGTGVVWIWDFVQILKYKKMQSCLEERTHV